MPSFTRRLAVGILAALVTIPLLANVVAAAPDPLTCTGYPEPRVFIETQDWWEPIPELGGLGHIHAGACFPLGQTVSGMLHLDYRVIFHNNKGTLEKIQVEDAGVDTVVLRLRPNLTPPDGMDSTYWFGLDIDTTKFLDGQRNLRIHTVLRHANGNEENARPIMPIDIENGKPDNDDNTTWIKPTSWYKEDDGVTLLDWSYLNANMRRDTFPTAPVSGTWRPVLKATNNGNITPATPAIALSEAFIDPDFHHGSEGIRVLTYSGAYSAALPIDTTQLANGPHKLVFVVTQFGQNGKRHSAVGAYPFTVAN